MLCVSEPVCDVEFADFDQAPELRGFLQWYW
jgi:hypothetical protein